MAALVVAATLIGCERPVSRPLSGAVRRSDEPRPPASAFSATVERVVDGDTVIARRSPGGPRVRVRLIGVDSPESVKSGTPVQCYGTEAASYLERVLEGRRVTAAYEGGGHLDRFGRELWDLWLVDGTFVAGQEVELGLARALRVRPQVDHAAYLGELQAAAQAGRRGLWEACSQ